MRIEYVAACGVAEFVFHPIGLDDHGHAGFYPTAQWIARVQPEKAEKIAQAGCCGTVVRCGEYDCVHDTEAHTSRHSRNSSSLSATERDRSQAASACAATASKSRQPFST